MQVPLDLNSLRASVMKTHKTSIDINVQPHHQVLHHRHSQTQQTRVPLGDLSFMRYSEPTHSQHHQHNIGSPLPSHTHDANVSIGSFLQGQHDRVNKPNDCSSFCLWGQFSAGSCPCPSTALQMAPEMLHSSWTF